MFNVNILPELPAEWTAQRVEDETLVIHRKGETYEFSGTKSKFAYGDRVWYNHNISCGYIVDIGIIGSKLSDWTFVYSISPDGTSENACCAVVAEKYLRRYAQ